HNRSVGTLGRRWTRADWFNVDDAGIRVRTRRPPREGSAQEGRVAGIGLPWRSVSIPIIWSGGQTTRGELAVLCQHLPGTRSNSDLQNICVHLCLILFFLWSEQKSKPN